MHHKISEDGGERKCIWQGVDIGSERSQSSSSIVEGQTMTGIEISKDTNMIKLFRNIETHEKKELWKSWNYVLSRE